MSNIISLRQPEEGEYLTPYTVDLFALTDPAQAEAYIGKFKDLPPATLKLATDFSTAEFIEEKLGPAHQLNNEQKKELTRILREILLQSLPLNKVLQEISTRLVTDGDTAKAIGTELSDFLQPFVQEMRKAIPLPVDTPEPQPTKISNTTDNIVNLRK